MPPYTSEERTLAKNMFCAGPLLNLFIHFQRPFRRETRYAIVTKGGHRECAGHYEKRPLPIKKRKRLILKSKKAYFEKAY